MAKSLIEIDGSEGEGGGQVLRSSLALSLITGQPFKIVNIRARREKSGLLRQHLTAVQAAAALGNAKLTGAALGSSQLEFTPGPVAPGEYNFQVGTAGSATLVLQTVLPALLTASGPSTLNLEGGTHNPMAPSYDFLVKTFLPLLERMGAKIDTELHQPGFYPAGGGRFSVRVTPVAKLKTLHLIERGEMQSRLAIARVAALPKNIAERELQRVADRLGFECHERHAEVIENSRGPGNVLVISLASKHVTEVVTGFGERGVSAERVADNAIDEVREYLTAEVPVGSHLADQLMLPLALAGDGSFRTLSLTPHSTTNMAVIQRFLPKVKFSTEPISRLACQVNILTTD